MSYSIYGIRLKGDPEARYIGQTCQPLEVRLFGHVNAARRMPRPTAFARWLLAVGENVEVVKIAAVETLKEARTTEQVTIALCLRLGHRLFNRHHVPAELRLPEYEIAA